MELNLYAYEFGGCLSASHSSYYEIPIEVQFKQGVSIASGDLQSTELIQRNSRTTVKINEEGGCDKEMNLKVDLGNIGQLQSEEILRIRYVFNEIEQPEIKNLFYGIGTISIAGEKVYPSTIRLSR